MLADYETLVEKSEAPASASPEQDERIQLIERIISTAPFQKSQRFRALLRYLTDRSLYGTPADFTETKIGIRVFERPADYSTVEDSTVRVHVRQLRLKLHEYFDSDGRNEPLIVEIPKGGFVPVFRPATQRTFDISTPPTTPAQASSRWRSALLPLLTLGCTLLAVLCVTLAYRLHAVQPIKGSDWPLNAVFSPQAVTPIIVGDANLGISDMLAGKQSTLAQYLDDSSPTLSVPSSDPSGRIAQMLRYVKTSNLTSYADAYVVSTLSSLAAEQKSHVEVRLAREMHLRDFEDGNYVLLGSSASDPWVSLFENRLNFQLTQDPVTRRTVWLNKHPQPGEQASYQGLESTGSSGEEYADIALLPSQNGRGNVLIIQGMQQEGTEAAGRFLDDTSSRETLRNLLHSKGAPNDSPYFEVLLKSSTVAGAPTIATIVSVRIIPAQ